jgi:hypothetical protein
VTVTPEHELPRPATAEVFSDAVTIGFGDPAAGVYGLARVALSRDRDHGETVATGLGMMFADGGPIAVRAAGATPETGGGWESAEAAGVRTAVTEPLRRWSVGFRDQDGQNAFELELRACGPPAELPGDAQAVRLGGMAGYEQLCDVTGTATVRGSRRSIACRGQRGHTWGSPDWERIALARTVSAWIDDGPGIILTAIRPHHVRGHGEEAVAAFLFEPAAEDGEHLPQLMGDPRLSTIYDADGRQRRAGLELYRDEDDEMGRRLAGDAVCGTTLELAQPTGLRLDCAFFQWRMEGRTGVGRYDVVRRVAPDGA